MLTGLFAFGVGLVSLTFLGCGSNSGTTPTASPSPKAVDTAPRTVELTDTTLAQLDAFVAKQKGKVVLIDCWATTCIPCKKAFPHTVALHEKHEKDGLFVITLTTDPADYRAKAIQFLKDQNATCTNFFLADPKPSKELDEKYPSDALPAYILFDRAGNRAKAFVLGADEAELDAAVEKLLAAK
jgi:thiol-disulfide isomerase/thioredoxin